MDKTQHLRTGRSLNNEERECMVKEYLTGYYTKREIWKKHTGQEIEHGQLLSWMREFGYADGPVKVKRRKKMLSLSYHSTPILTPGDPDTDPSALLRRIKDLEKKLETAQLRAEGYELMIYIAEKELSIPIRKKPDSK